MIYDTIDNAQTVAGNGEGTLLSGRYRVVRQLGRGGMGSVWLAEDTQLDGKPFAVKMLPAILVSNKRAYAQLKAEALVAMKLVHPNIVQVRAFEENDGNPFLVMDYVDGQTLDDYLAENGTLTEDEVIRVLRPVAAALDYAHAKGVVHRDVKPGNVMIAKDGTPCILDFGIAREIQETMTRVTGKLSSGTLLYMSPEQLNGRPPTKEQDIYSFAAMAYECLKGEPPFVRGNIEFQILNNPPESLAGRDGLIAPLVAGVMAGLSKKPEERPPRCMDILAQSEDALKLTRPMVRMPAPVTAAERIAHAERTVLVPTAAHLDADVYLLETEARDVFANVVEKMPTHVCRELDESLAKTKLSFRAASSAISRGDSAAAKKLFSEVVRYPAQRRAMATSIALEAFDAQKWKTAMSAAPEAEPEDPQVLFWRGYCMNMGYGCAKDEKASVELYRRAADLGHPTAMFNLAVTLESGIGCEKDVPQAIELFRKVADKGDVEAQQHVGDIYFKGELVAQDMGEALKWYRIAAENGDGTCQAKLGWLYESGNGVKQDVSAAKEWYRRAEKSGDKMAASRLAEMLAEEERLRAEEAARKAEEERKAAEAARKAEEARRAEEARKAEEARRKAEEERKAEMARRAEEARKAEEERKAEETRKAEERKARAAARKAEQERWAAEVRKTAEAARKAAEEQARKAEEERKAAEAARKAEEARKAEDDRQAEELREEESARRSSKLRRFAICASAAAVVIAVAVGGLFFAKAKTEASEKMVRAEKALAVLREADAEKYAKDSYSAIAARYAAGTNAYAGFSYSNASTLFDAVCKTTPECEKAIAEAKELARQKAEAAAKELARQKTETEGKKIAAEKVIASLRDQGAQEHGGEAFAKIEAMYSDGTNSFAVASYVDAGARFDKVCEAAPVCEKAIAEGKRLKRIAEVEAIKKRISAAQAEVSKDGRKENFVRQWNDAVTALNRGNDKCASRDFEGAKQEYAKALKLLESMPKTVDTKTITLPGGATMEMIYVAPGSFTMGSPESEAGRFDTETQHRVTLTKGYWLGKYEVTQRQWESVMGGNPSYFKGDDLPVENVSWDDCQRFVAKVDAAARRQFGGGARLPTEAEWEYACRAGSTGAYGGTGNLDDMGWYADNSGRETHAVGQKRANAWGFHDMHGNVLEWCQDWFGKYDGDKTDPTGPASGDSRVLRGGSWNFYARLCRSAYRYGYWPGYRSCNFGFRLCCSAGPRESVGQEPDAQSVPAKVGPVAKIEILVDGRMLGAGATVKIGDTNWTIPVAWDIEDGKTYGPYNVSHESGGKRYFGTLERFTVDWRGPRAMTVALKEYTDPKTGDTKTLTLPGGATMEMIYVAPGTFTMGSPEYEEGRSDDETQHRVTLTKGYWLGKYEVTQAQWERVMGGNPSCFKGAYCPVETVSWEDCQRFVANVDAAARRQFGSGARLPTEAEWEYACRAGTTTAYSWGNSLNGDRANCDGNYPCGTTVKGRYRGEAADVGSYSPNAWGFHDMHGNVWEWCQDWSGAYSGDATNPTGPASGDLRVLRGGCWNFSARFCRSAYRYRGGPGSRDIFYGFRLCCSAGSRESVGQEPDAQSVPAKVGPVAKIEILVDGRMLGAGATVKIGDTNWTIPVAWDIEDGKTYGPYNVSHESGGRRYFGTLERFTADWRGPRTMTVALKESRSVVLKNGRKGVQLWENGPYWATTNIGAEKPEDSGCYFWWGDTVGYKRVGDSWMASDGSQSSFRFSADNAPTCGKSIDALRSEGWITADGVLAPEHDAAHTQWGGDWRMPTKQELYGLSSKCDWTWTTLNGVKGHEVRGKGAYVSASIFLPCAGYGHGASLCYAGSYGYDWSSVPDSGANGAWGLNFYSGGRFTSHLYIRYHGQSVRPVQGFTK